MERRTFSTGTPWEKVVAYSRAVIPYRRRINLTSLTSRFLGLPGGYSCTAIAVPFQNLYLVSGGRNEL